MHLFPSFSHLKDKYHGQLRSIYLSIMKRYLRVGSARALGKVCLPIDRVFAVVVLLSTCLGSCAEQLVFRFHVVIFYKTHSCVQNVGSILGSSMETVGHGINGTSNCTHGSEQEKGNVGDLHGEGLEALVENIGKMSQVIAGRCGFDETDIL